ncbi:DUF262 domain-containing protein [Janthinobacterium sp. FW305-129]|uniref:DUF262 domain-containing protein n=1 Tax=Janthinobacterium sp. FW305-129 TaxID=2775054 RepID=UPI001E5333F2|nr:DUF262 domain-containing protein [Janthinobacterium sp. FW305-129]MCC7596182.1 DUF262 domain-containing protein [Janthinobacterium sp. FW305-129]
MKIEAHDKQIQDIFSLGYFQIPRFQRPYSWERDEVENFWNDIINDVSENYFIGSMVVYQERKPYFGIVDGQQRLTTITLMLSAIRNSFLRLGEDNLAKGVHKFVEQPNIDNEAEFILDADTSFPYLQDHIQSFNGLKIDCDVGIEEQKLKNAFEIICARLEDEVPTSNSESGGQISMFPVEVPDPILKLKEIRDKVLSLKLVFIQLDNKSDAHLIFETLNARGRDLRTSDLVKNLLLSKIKEGNAKLDSAKESWNSLIRKFDDASESEIIDSFLLHFWISEYNYTTDKKLFSAISKFVSEDEKNANDLLRKLNHAAAIYCKLIDPGAHEWSREETDVKESLKTLRLFKVKQQSSMTLALLRAYYEKRLTLRNLKTCLRKLEYFHFVFNAVTSQRSSGVIATTYSSHAISLTRAKGNDDIQAIISSLFYSLKTKLPQYEEFEVKFLELSYLSSKTKNKGIIKYCLSKQFGDKFGGIDINHDAMSIEHIISESTMKDGKSSDVVGSIGNLLLVDEKTNSEELMNLTVSEKIKKLKGNGYPLAKALVGEEFSENSRVQDRARSIAQHLYNSVQL